MLPGFCADRKTAIRMSSRELCLRKLDPRRIEKNATIYIIGKRGAGKTTAMVALLRALYDRFDFGIAFVPHAAASDKFGEVIDESSIYLDFEIERIQKMLALQTVLTDSGIHKHLYLLFDDMMFKKGLLKSETMREVMMNSRNLDITFFNSAQWLMDPGTETRGQIDYLFVGKDNVLANREKLWRNYFGVFEKFEDFNRTMLECTQNYEWLVLDTRQPKTSPHECVYWWKADLPVPGRKYPRLHDDDFHLLHRIFSIPRSVRWAAKKEEVYAKLQHRQNAAFRVRKVTTAAQSSTPSVVASRATSKRPPAKKTRVDNGRIRAPARPVPLILPRRR